MQRKLFNANSGFQQEFSYESVEEIERARESERVMEEWKEKLLIRLYIILYLQPTSYIRNIQIVIKPQLQTYSRSSATDLGQLIAGMISCERLNGYRNEINEHL